MKLAMKSRNDAKEYFSDEGTVAGWWNPEGGDSLLALHFKKQVCHVTEQFDWIGKDVLDVGTGRGRFAISFALKGANVYAMDIARELLQLVENESDGVGARIELGLWYLELQ